MASSQPAARPDTLEIKGVQLRLGMDENTVAQKLREKSVGVQESRELADTWFLCQQPGEGCEHIGQLFFRNRHLDFIEKRWVDETQSSADAFGALYGIAKDLETRGLTRCQISSNENFLPGLESQGIEVKCGEHLSLDIERIRSMEDPPMVYVEERLR